jgi:hypothetical protein
MKKYVIAGVNYGRNLDAKISANFSYWEFVSSDKAVRLGIKNVPTEQEWQRIEILVKEVLQPLREKIGGISITSGFRCKKLNDAVGSSDTSFHRLGCAVDIEPSDVSMLDALKAVHDLGKYTELIAEFFPHGWVHVGYVKNDSRKMLKLKDATHSYSAVTIAALTKMYG